MVSNDSDDSRRNTDGAESNPFIAWRHHIDARVSSLRDSVFTLRTQLAHQIPLHQMEKQNKLKSLEQEMARVVAEGRESFWAGDMQAALEKRAELLKLSREADTLWKDLAKADTRKDSDSGYSSPDDSHTTVVERVANAKGQQWGWSWNWSYPRPFNADDQSPSEDHNDKHTRRHMCRWRHRRADQDISNQGHDDDWDAHFNAKWDNIKRRMNEEVPCDEDGAPRVWKKQWSWSWPPRPSDAPEERTSDNRPQTLFDELSNAIMDEVTRLMLPRPHVYPTPSYSPRALEENAELTKAGLQWRDAFEDLVRAERGAPLIPAERLGQSNHVPYNQWVRRFWQPDFASSEPAWEPRRGYPKRVPWEGEETSEEPSYEYGHDHEDQHDDPPTPKPSRGKFTEGEPPTELEAYERLLGPAPTQSETANAARPSILSTLTTTERTVSPDGSVTTKVVLKKRFQDGREESSETVHTQRGQDTEPQVQDQWKAMQEAQFPGSPKRSEIEQEMSKSKGSKSGWFWSK
ncbi:uncharacterized protein BDR25DRAFT_306811 [Lindgomyces ingoldianus]|uniref:Uncharacterized protein n=1 Tax=Lindgomyces ingoldianus TaxID=673940 RepID=A0ACB6QDV6_9PLEO|nr:uncharacterized protein BDR25DRAFT_306811 [Lindgomyces ingoldianus]KAF2465169.1 hypothetical protein BDR25DRAFT_306811 [Lindgomyces ingoldianus]